MRKISARRIGAVVLLLCASATALWGQLQTGNLYGTVTDKQGEPLPGVTVKLSGIGAPKVQVTDAEGQFRFLGLDPGSYQLNASLDGFSTLSYPRVQINVGRNTTLGIELTSAIEETITVTSESPLLDSRKVVSGTTVTSVELEKIPTARDPWSVLNQVPGVLTDRINVGGNESGQQSFFVGPGSQGNDNVFSVDGVIVTDMAAVGASPTYYNFDAFEEMQLATGGTDIQLATSGVALNMVTKRGTNEWRGSASYLLADSGWQSTSRDPGTRIGKVEETGVEVGGMVLRDRLWIWGSYGQNDVDNLLIGDTTFPENIELENYNAKINAQLTDGNSAVVLFSDWEKLKFGQGAGPSRPPETTWNLASPTEMYKLEDTHVFSSDFYLTGLWAELDGGFRLIPRGGLDRQILFDSNGVFRNTFLSFETTRPVDQARLDGNYFFNTGDVSHDLKFGVGFRHVELRSQSVFPGGAIVLEQDGPGGNNFAQIFGSNGSPTTSLTTEYQSAYIQDTMMWGPFTFNLGLRRDEQKGTNDPLILPGSTLVPEGVLPPLVFDGNNGGFEWEDITPRIGITYALGEERKTLLRSSFARFAEQLNQQFIGRVGPDGPHSNFVFFTDTDGDLEFDPGEPFIPFGPSGFDPLDPAAPSIPNQNAGDLEAPLTSELLLSIEHALLPEFVVGATFTLRETDDHIDRKRLIEDPVSGVIRPAGRGDFFQDGVITETLPDGSTVTVPTFSLFAPLTGGVLLHNGPRSSDYQGFGISFTKRLANRWMARGHLDFHDWSWNVPGDYFYDANDLAPGSGLPFDFERGVASDDDGAVVAPRSLDSFKGDVLLNSGWSFNLNGLYQLAPERPWGFDIAGNISAREGYPLPYYKRVRGRDGLSRDIQLQPTDAVRTDDVFLVDLRLEKEFAAGGNLSCTLSIDGFNILDESTVLQRERNLADPRGGQIDEVLSPRVFRVGFRLNWR